MKIGKVSDNVLKRSVLRQIHTQRDEILSGAGIGEDCAIFASFAPDSTAVCVQEAAVSPKEGIADRSAWDSGGIFPVIPMEQLILRCANNLAAAGAVPLAVMITLLLPKTAEENILKQLMREAEDACRLLNIQIAGGQTRVTAAVKTPCAAVTGLGRVSLKDCRTAKAARPGQDIVVSKWIGLEGTSLLAKYNRQKLLARYPACLVEEAVGFDRFLSVLPEAATAVKSGVCAMHDASEGGILAALWELAEGAGVGLTIDLRKLPVRQETVEVCECLGVNPYELLSGGCLVMTADDGAGLCAALASAQIPAVTVGRTTDSNERILLKEDEISYLNRPNTDQIY